MIWLWAIINYNILSRRQWKTRPPYSAGQFRHAVFKQRKVIQQCFFNSNLTLRRVMAWSLIAADLTKITHACAPQSNRNPQCNGVSCREWWTVTPRHKSRSHYILAITANYIARETTWEEILAMSVVVWDKAGSGQRNRSNWRQLPWLTNSHTRAVMPLHLGKGQYGKLDRDKKQKGEGWWIGGRNERMQAILFTLLLKGQDRDFTHRKTPN